MKLQSKRLILDYTRVPYKVHITYMAFLEGPELQRSSLLLSYGGSRYLSQLPSSTSGGIGKPGSWQGYEKPTTQFLQDYYNLPNQPLYVFNTREAYLPEVRSLYEGTSGIYLWHNAAPQIEDGGLNKGYVGSAQDMGERPFRHVRPAGPKNVNFREAFFQYGKTSFFLVIVQLDVLTADTDEVTVRAMEQVYLDCIPKPLQYNSSSSASSPKGRFVRTQEFKDRLSQANTGVKNPNYGFPISDATKELQRLRKLTVSVSICATHDVTGETMIFSSMAETSRYFNTYGETIRRNVGTTKRMGGVWLLTKHVPSSGSN